MTSLVDVIFLLLLFFMLTSTFSKFSEVPLSTAAQGGAANGEAPLFLQLFPDRLTLNGEAGSLAALDLSDRPDSVLLVALQPDVSAQRLTDLLVHLHRFPEMRVTVLGAS